MVVYSQDNTIEIKCQGETLTTTKGVTSTNNLINTVFVINKDRKTIYTIKENAYNKTKDSLLITTFYKQLNTTVYNCINEGNNKIALTVTDTNLHITLPDGASYTYNIISQTSPSYYVYHDTWAQLDTGLVKKQIKPGSSITGVYLRDASNSLEIIELKNKSLYFRFDLYNGTNLGMLEGILSNDAIVTFKNNEFGSCKMEFKFTASAIEVTTIDDGYDCGYGNGVYSDGTYLLDNNLTPSLLQE